MVDIQVLITCANPYPTLDVLVVEDKVDVPWSQSVGPNKIGVARRSLILVVAGQHALYAKADALNILHRTPSLAAQ